MFINYDVGEINLKIVYYGPSLGGKTTNLKYIHARTQHNMRSQLVTLKTNQGNTLFFDFMQFELGRVDGLRPKVKLFSMAGQVCFTISRRLLLRGTDCIIFVADSCRNRLVDNLESWHTMERHLAEMNEDIRTFPVILQLNKRDSSDIVSKELLCQTLGIKNQPCFDAIATEGKGVLETLKAGLQAVISSYASSCQRRAA